MSVKKGVTKVGKSASRIKLEVEECNTAWLVGKIGVTVSTLPDGRTKLVFTVDSNSAYGWGQLDPKYMVRSVEIPVPAARCLDSAAASTQFTFTQPEAVEMEMGRICLTMPATLSPPRGRGPRVKRAKSGVDTPVVQTTSVSTQAPLPAATPPRPATAPRANLRELVAALNAALQDTTIQASVRLEGRRVIVTESYS